MWRMIAVGVVALPFVSCNTDKCPPVVYGLEWSVQLEEAGTGTPDAATCDALCREEEYGIEPERIDSCAFRTLRQGESDVHFVDCVGRGHPDCI